MIRKTMKGPRVTTTTNKRTKKKKNLQAAAAAAPGPGAAPRRRRPQNLTAATSPSLFPCSPSRHLRSFIRLQSLKQFLLFLPLAILLLKRIWVPFQGSIIGGGHMFNVATIGEHDGHSTLQDYLDVSHAAVSQRFKHQKQHQVSSLSYSTMEPYYSLERITSFERIGRSTCSISLSPFSWWGNNKKEKRMTWIENKYLSPSSSSTSTSEKRYNPMKNIDDGADEQQSSTRQISNFPRRLHIYTPSRCVSNDVQKSIELWYGNSTTTTSGSSRKISEITWDIFVHDEKALTRLLNVESVEGDFPEMRPLLRHCLSSTHNNKHNRQDNSGNGDKDISELRQDLWQLIVLYVYGGVYVSPTSALPAAEEGHRKPKQEPPKPVVDVQRLLNDIDRSSLSSPSGVVVLFESGIPSTPSPSSNQHDEQPRAAKYFNPGVVASSPKHPFLFLTVRHLLLGIMYDDIYDRGDLYGDGAPDDELEDYDLPPVSQALQRAWVDFSSSKSSATENDETTATMSDIRRNKNDKSKIRVLKYVHYFPPPDPANENEHKGRLGKMFSHFLRRKKKKIDPSTSGKGSRTTATATAPSSTCLQKMAEAASNIDFI
mmetsp:Transcript_36192/g.87059  ORF Transcript_36192/g.87059 Transcript_36192/m.87059 type:complete len:599 (-) Transcript_36192:747-2543(-)